MTFLSAQKYSFFLIPFIAIGGLSMLLAPPSWAWSVAHAEYKSIQIKSRSSYHQPYSFTVVIDANRLNVRSGPGLNHRVITQVTRGMRFVVHNSTPEWLYIALPHGKFGWISARYAYIAIPPV